MSNKKDVDTSKRDFVKTAAYVAPVILSMKALPAFASTGSNSTDVTPPTGPL